MATTEVAHVLPVGVGYAVVVGIGFFFAAVMAGISWLQNRYTAYSTKTSEEFNTASRSVKPGLIASGIVSAWTWAGTLLVSSTVAYTYGIAGPFWYAAGATVQILMFAILACKTKQNAPYCHTYLEIIQVRYGKLAHIIYVFFALVTNVLVSSQLLLGGSAVVTALTGMNTYAAIFLIPLGVCVYVVLGGLRATFLCMSYDSSVLIKNTLTLVGDYSHTLILMIIILYFMFNVYTGDGLINSPGEMWELLKEAATKRPVDGNQDGSYMTMKSNYALIFGVIQLCSGSGTVFLDQAYWQRAIASRPTTAVRAYILGGLAWFAIPFGFATTLGLTAVALADNPKFPTYPNVMSPSQVSAGLASPFAATALLGTSGAVALLIVLFMAVTSCASAELIATSSILTFDVYKMYIKPNATGPELVLVSHLMIGVWGLVMAIFAIIWNVVGIDLGWLFLVMGLLIGGAVIPVALTVIWEKQTRAGAISGALVGLCAGLAAWLAEAKSYYGEITLYSTGQEYPTLAGNLAALATGAIVTISVSLLFPAKEKFTWEVTRAINASAGRRIDSDNNHNADLDTVREEEKQMREVALEEEEPRKLRSALKLAIYGSFTITFVMGKSKLHCHFYEATLTL